MLSGSGASYGGCGGAGKDGVAPTEKTIGNITEANQFGSGGGSGPSSTSDSGGSGGGIITITASAYLTVDGNISSSGADGNGTGGGGSGGSIAINTPFMIGDGALRASGQFKFLYFHTTINV